MDLHAPVVALNIGTMIQVRYRTDFTCGLWDLYQGGGAHCAPLMHQALGTTEAGAVPFSMSYYNTGKRSGPGCAGREVRK